MDASGGARRRDDLGGRYLHAGGGSESTDLYDAAGVERARSGTAVSTARGMGHGGGHRQLAGVERDGRTLGARGAGHEEDGLERDTY